MEHLKNELKEEMIRNCKKETLEQPSLGRWARGEGRLEMREQGGKAEAKDHNDKNNQEGVEDKRQSQQQLGATE